MIRYTTRLMYGRPSKYSWFDSRTIFSPVFHSTNRYGPEPIGMAILLGGAQIHAGLPGRLQDVPGQDPDPPREEARRIRLVVGHPVGVAVHDLGLPDLSEGLGIGGRRLRIDHVTVGEVHVIGRDLLAVVPLRPLPQMERDRHLVFGDVPPLRQFPLHLQVLVGPDEVGVDQAADLVGGRIAGDVGDETADVADGGLDQRVPVGRASCVRRRARGVRPTAGRKRHRGEERRGKQDCSPPGGHFRTGRCPGHYFDGAGGAAGA